MGKLREDGSKQVAQLEADIKAKDRRIAELQGELEREKSSKLDMLVNGSCSGSRLLEVYQAGIAAGAGIATGKTYVIGAPPGSASVRKPGSASSSANADSPFAQPSDFGDSV